MLGQSLAKGARGVMRGAYCANAARSRRGSRQHERQSSIYYAQHLHVSDIPTMWVMASGYHLFMFLGIGGRV